MGTRLSCASAALMTTLTATMLCSGTAAAATPTPAVPMTSLAPGKALRPGTDLRSPNGHYLLVLRTNGDLAIIERGNTRWHTGARGDSPALALHSNGNLVVTSHKRTIWQTGTAGATRARLHLTNSGVLTLSATGGTAWSNTLVNGCAGSHGVHHVIVDVSQQRARLCAHHQQILVTSVTTGASSKGDATPKGTWRIYTKVRNTVLHPAGGGAYHVHYWMPYHGAYGMHDSPWQHFAYGSPLYKTRGSHGCVHFPAAAMTRLFAWAPVGTRVTVHR